jgi:hypothetical protein
MWVALEHHWRVRLDVSPWSVLVIASALAPMIWMAWLDGHVLVSWLVAAAGLLLGSVYILQVQDALLFVVLLHACLVVNSCWCAGTY